MAERKGYFVFMLVISFLLSVTCLPEPGKKELNFDKVSDYWFGQLLCLAGVCFFCFLVKTHLNFEFNFLIPVFA